MNVIPRDHLLTEGVVAKFLRYVQIDSPSGEGEGVPSTPEQWEMARFLAAELTELGLADVKVDDHAIVTATLPGNVDGAPVIGLLAHYDTFPGTPGHGVKPQVHKGYQGGEIVLPAGPRLSPATHPALAKAIGHDVITSDGSTLLGADDKAGVAEIMEAICRLINNPSLRRGTVKVAFTPDEETGKGADYFDVKGFGAVAAYTFDGSALGEVDFENFNARNLKITLTGRSSHTGTARGNMINAVHLAAEFVGSIPAHMRPETTTAYEGFIHPDAMQGTVEAVTIKVLLRDFTTEGLEHKQAIVTGLLAGLEQRHPGCKATFTQTGSYRNMKEALDRMPRVTQLAIRAVQEIGVEPQHRAIRGGTDGAKLSEMGLPTPNLFTGGMNYHSRTEWASVQWMEQAVEMGVRLVTLWAE